ncbi:isochorismatase family cysteine hydrolase [Aquabacterium sp.]|uniref:cysteine hydrolase family protein n=1 Tax=Aquabacterium sp. TaxID=1872578 RepID=UPI00248A130E|nr:isochorismatase family cysteine hydrolase [Aquabacterium sp.]MDI1261527.1 cysteine hydrolase [Aquabacterium sp.]
MLIIDMMSEWRFPSSEPLLRHAARIAPAIEALRARCDAVGVPVVYVNDNHGRWRSDLRKVVQDACAQEGPGGDIARSLAPRERDYFVLKPKHSGFYATPLELLLRHLHVGQLILTGVSTEHCVSMTATDACMRDFKVWCPADGVASHTPALRDRTLTQLQESLCICTDPSPSLRLPELV